MDDTAWAQVIAAVVGAVITVLFRLIDRWIPDDSGKHPLPDRPPPVTTKDPQEPPQSP